MQPKLSQLVIADPSVELVTTFSECLNTAEAGLDSMSILASDSVLTEVINACIELETRFSFSPTKADPLRVRQDLEPSEPSPDSNEGEVANSRETKRRTPSDTVTLEPNGGQLRHPTPVETGNLSLPIREEYLTTDDWLSSTARYFQVEVNVLEEIVRTYSAGIDAEQKRRTLELVFGYHLERTQKGEHAYVDIRIANTQSPIRYHYLDNGPDRGGAHLFQNLTPQMKAEISYHATSENLDVLADGEGFVSVSHGHPAVSDDVGFAERIISEVLDASMSDIIRIDEVIDRDETRTWLD